MELVQTPIQPDLLAGSKDIVEGIESGHIVGLAVVVQLRGGKFFVDVMGRMSKQPHSARGWVLALDDYLRDLAGQRNHRSTTT